MSTQSAQTDHVENKEEVIKTMLKTWKHQPMTLSMLKMGTVQKKKCTMDGLDGDGDYTATYYTRNRPWKQF